MKPPPKKRKEFLRALLRAAERAALFGVVLFVVWSSANRWHVRYVASHLSWGAVDFWRAQCLGMKGFEITGVKVDVGAYLPNLSSLPRPAAMEEMRRSVAELQTKGLVRRDIPPEACSNGAIIQNNEATPLGKKVCTYYLNEYRLPAATDTATPSTSAEAK